MKEKITIDKVLRYIKRKTNTTEDGKEVVSKLHAELAAKMAFEGGIQSVLDNIPELEWGVVHYLGKETLRAYPLGAYFKIEFAGMEFERHCNEHFITRTLSLSDAKQAALLHYKNIVKKALGL
nr:MAG TPA: hypothetical protein [Caudoviricetes sp.]